MQLKNKKKIAGLLSAATCTLLGAPAQADERPWDIDTAILFYSESDSRIQAVEPVISAKKEIDDEEYLALKL